MKEILNSVHFQKDSDVSTELTTSVLKQYLITKEMYLILLGMQAYTQLYTSQAENTYPY